MSEREDLEQFEAYRAPHWQITIADLRAKNEQLRELVQDLYLLIDWTISPKFQARIDAAIKDTTQ